MTSCALDKAGQQRALVRELVIRKFMNSSDDDVRIVLNTTKYELSAQFGQINTKAAVALDYFMQTGDGVSDAITHADEMVKELSRTAAWCWQCMAMLAPCVLCLFYLAWRFNNRLKLTNQLMQDSPIPLLVIENKQLVFVNNAFQQMYNLVWQQNDDRHTYTEKMRKSLPLLYQDQEELQRHAEIIQMDVPPKDPLEMWLTPLGSDKRIRIQLQNNFCDGILWCTIIDINASYERSLVQKERDFVCGKLEAQKEYEKLCRGADNHILHNCKNIFISVRDALNGQSGIAHFDMIQSALNSGVSICHDREFFNLIEQGSYVTKSKSVNIGLLAVETADKHRLQLQKPIPVGFFDIDTKVFDVVMRDVVMNAKVHGCVSELPQLSVTCEDDKITIALDNAVGQQMTHSHGSSIGLRNMFKCVDAVGWEASLDIGQTSARFSLRIPVPDGTKVPTLDFDVTNKTNARVMALDDSGLIRLSTRQVLTYFLNCADDAERVYVHGCTQEEIENFAELVAKVSPAVVLLDFNLESTLDGYDVLLNIRKNKFDGPVVVRSANSTDADIQNYLQMGFTECVGKEKSILPVLEKYIK